MRRWCASVDSIRRCFYCWLGVAADTPSALIIIRPWAEFPLLDDWVYAKDCLQSALQDRPVFTGYESAWTLPQLLYGTLLTKTCGFSHVLLRMTNVAALGGVVVAFDSYLRHIRAGRAARCFAGATIAFHPFAVPEALSFMTDLPFLLFWVIACYCWDRALEARATSWLVSAVVVTILAVAQRQFGLFIPLAAILLLLWPLRRSPRRAWCFVQIPPRDFLAKTTLGLLVIALFTISILVFWHFYVHGYMAKLVSHRPIIATIDLLYITANSFALTSIPLLLATRTGPATRSFPPALRWELVAIFVPAAAWHLVTGQLPVFGNVISQFGFLLEETLLGRRPALLALTSSRIIVLAGVAAFALLVQRLFPPTPTDGRHREQATNAPLSAPPFGGVLIVASAIYMSFVLLRGVSVFDRYTLPAVLAILFAVARRTQTASPGHVVTAGGAVLAVALLSITLTHDYFRWREAAWNAAELQVGRGTPAFAIQAGYEWNGWCVGRTPFPSGDLRTFEYVVSHSPLPGYRVIEETPWYSIWAPHDRHVYLLVRNPATD